MSDNLYDTNPQPQTVEQSTQATSAASDGGFFSGIGDSFGNFFSSFSGFNLESVIDFLHYFALGWMILYVVLYLVNYFVWYWFIAPMDAYMVSQRNAMKQWETSKSIYLWYLPSLALWVGHKLVETPWVSTLLGVVFILYTLYKILFRDLPQTPIIQILAGKDTTFVGQMLGPFGQYMKRLNLSKASENKTAGNFSFFGFGIFGAFFDIIRQVILHLSSIFTGQNIEDKPKE